MSFESFEIFVYYVFYFHYFFHSPTRQIILKSNEKEKEKLYPLIRLIKHEKTTNSIGTPVGRTGMKKIKFIVFVGQK